jgi:hypothetical protein
MSKSFLEEVRTRDWSADPQRHYDLIFGDRSVLVHSLKRSANTGQYQALVQGIEQFLNPTRSPELLLRHEGDAAGEESRHIAEGLRSTLQALQLWAEKRGAPPAEEIVASFQAAVEAYDLAWPTGKHGSEPRGPVDKSGWGKLIREDPLWDLYLSVKANRTSIAFWTVWDLIDRLAVREDQTRSNVTRSAITPVLGAAPHAGLNHVLWLTVDLIPAPAGVLCPDPLSMGLMSIAAADAQQGETSLLRSVQKVWALSGVANKYRGRWRIASSCPATGTKFSDFRAPILRRLEGRSAEASTLAAVWAASGVIPYREEFRTDESMPLALDIAISASLGTPTPDEPLTSIPLEPVGSVGPKIAAAERIGLDAVLLAVDKTGSDQEGPLADANQRAAAAEPSSCATRVDRLETMAQAMDQLLLTNRPMYEHQCRVQREWLEMWEPGTADVEPSGGTREDDSNEANEGRGVAPEPKAQPQL